MTKAEAARVFLVDLLKAGPRPASEILATAEGANISGRTIQRASIGLGVVKTRAAFRSGWTWSLPAQEPSTCPQQPEREREAAPTINDRAQVIATRLQKLEANRGMKAPIHAGDPRLLRWVAAGVSDPDLREAYERAAFSIEGDGPVTAGMLDRYINEVMRATA